MQVLYNVIRCNLKYFQFSHETSTFLIQKVAIQQKKYGTNNDYANTNSDAREPMPRLSDDHELLITNNFQIS